MLRHVLITALAIICCASSAGADDTEIYGTVTNPSLEPNVLIIFDTSGSMSTEDVPGDPYDKNEIYSGSSDSDGVYQRTWSWAHFRWEWDLITGNVDSIQCEAIKDELQTVGYSTGYMRGAPDFTCGGSTEKRLRLGNYLNYVASGAGETRSRISVA
jgi:type IV pilus assembly protein PilY1